MAAADDQLSITAALSQGGSISSIAAGLRKSRSQHVEQVEETEEEKRQREEEAEAEERAHNEESAQLEWRMTVRTICESGAASVTFTEQMIDAVEMLRSRQSRAFERELSKTKARARYELELNEKKVQTKIGASLVETQNKVVEVELAHKVELQHVKQETEEQAEMYEAQLEQQQEEEQKLLQKITDLDGGLAAAEREKAKYTEHLAKAMARRLRNLGIAKGFTTWVEAHQEQRTLKWVQQRLCNMECSKAWEAWCELREERLRSERMLKSAASRLARPKLVQCLVRWRMEWEQAERRAEASSLRARINALEEDARRLRAAADLSAAELDETKQEATSLAEQVKQTRAASDRREMEARLQLQEKTATRALRRMQNRDLGIAWATWYGVWHEERLRGNSMRRFVGRLLNMSMSRGWQSWVVLWEARCYCHSVLERALIDLAVRDVRRLWEQWLGVCRYSRNVQLLTTVAMRMIRLAFVAAWNTWEDTWRVRSEQRRLLIKAMVRLRKPMLVAALEEWRESWEAEEGAREREARRANQAAELERLGIVLNRKYPPLSLTDVPPPSAEPELMEHQLRASLRAAEQELLASREETRRQAAKVEQAEGQMALTQSGLEAQVETFRAKAEEWDAKRDEYLKMRAEIEGSKSDFDRRLSSKSAQLAESSRQVVALQQEADALGHRLARTEEALERSGVPLSELERRTLVEVMQSKLDHELDEALNGSAQRVRELTQLLALRDRQLSTALARAVSAPKALDQRALRPSASAGLLVTPHLPEVAKEASYPFSPPPQKLELSVDLYAVMHETGAKSSSRVRRPASAKWESPFARRQHLPPAHMSMVAMGIPHRPKSASQRLHIATEAAAVHAETELPMAPPGTIARPSSPLSRPTSARPSTAGSVRGVVRGSPSPTMPKWGGGGASPGHESAESFLEETIRRGAAGGVL